MKEEEGRRGGNKVGIVILNYTERISGLLE